MKNLHLFTLGISLLLAAGCATHSHNADQCGLTCETPPAVTSPAGELRVVSAVYGSGKNFTDVTCRVNDLLNKPDGEFYARPEWLKADPTPGWNKSLVIVYEVQGERRSFTTGEGGRVTTETLLNPPKQKKQKK